MFGHRLKLIDTIELCNEQVGSTFWVTLYGKNEEIYGVYNLIYHFEHFVSAAVFTI